MFTHLGVSTDLTSDDIDEDRLKQCKYSYAEGYLWTGDGTKEATLTTFQYSKKHDLKIALSFSDPGLVAHVRDDFFYLTREYVDVVFCNADEARKFADMENVEEAAKVIGELAEMAFITDGKDGAIAVSEGNIQRVEGFNVNAVDTNGAGDNFASGVLYGLTHGYDPVKAARWGNYLASRVVQVHGARIEQNLKDQIPEILG
jgi:sugar/nucleoside kinase (ribokinase family)